MKNALNFRMPFDLALVSKSAQEAILEKSELHPNRGWVRISSFSLEYCGVINRIMEGDETTQSATRCNTRVRF